MHRLPRFEGITLGNDLGYSLGHSLRVDHKLFFQAVLALGLLWARCYLGAIDATINATWGCLTLTLMMVKRVDHEGFYYKASKNPIRRASLFGE